MAVCARYIYLNKVLNHSYVDKHVLSWIRLKSTFCTIPKSKRILQYRLIHTQQCLFKRRKTADERKSSNMIEYSPKSKSDIVQIWRGITLTELAKILNRDLRYATDLFLSQIKSPDEPIMDIKQIQAALKRGGNRMQIIGKPRDEIEDSIERDVFPRPPPNKADLKPRPPVVTVMGHVDHGKTTLLDALRHSSVVAQEFGGITQHIGAFSVQIESGAKITFLDTPGHAAFSAMRARGANLTDIVVLVVAADDGVMEQTVESVKMARQAQVPILVAINKIDSPKADVERTENMLVEIGIQVERLGGDVQAVPISALKRRNLKELIEALILQAELLQVSADPKGPVEGVVVESKVDQHRGKLSTIVVQRGTLTKGDILIAGTAFAKVRSIRSAEGKPLDKVPPGYPAEIDGWRELPTAGDQVLQVDSEKVARSVAKFRENAKQVSKQEEDLLVISEKSEQHQREYQEKLTAKRMTGRFKVRNKEPRKPESIAKDNGTPSLNLVIKGDVDGSVEAILDALDTYDSNDCKLDLVHYGVGAVTPTDIELAEPFDAIIYAFNVNAMQNLESSSVRHFNVIYKLIDDIKSEINKRLPTKEVEEILGEASVLQQFEINQGKKKIPVAGCRCVKGMLKKSAMYRLVRNGEVVYTGTLSSMRHLKNEVDTIKTDLECGLQLSDKSIEFKQGDSLVCFQKKSVPQETDWDPGF